MNLNSGIPLNELSSEIRPQDDLFRHVNETWLAATPIPADKATYGTFVILAEEAERNTRVILEEARTAPVGTEMRKLGAWVRITFQIRWWSPKICQNWDCGLEFSVSVLNWGQ